MDWVVVILEDDKKDCDTLGSASRWLLNVAITIMG